MNTLLKITVKIVVAVIIAISFYSCSEKSPVTMENTKCYVAAIDSTTQGELFLYSSMYKSIRTIILETKEECLLGAINKLRVYDDFIIILDNNIAKNIFVFDKQGNFVRKIGSSGQGAGEYVKPADFTIDPDGKIIYVLDAYMQRINKYDIFGNFINSINLDGGKVRSQHIEYMNGKLYSDAYYHKHSDENFLIRTIDPDSGKIENYYLNAAQYNKGWSNTFFIENNAFYPFGDNAYVFIQQYMDTVMLIKDDKITPFIVVDSKEFITAENVEFVNSDDNSTSFGKLFGLNKIFQVSNFVKHDSLVFLNYLKGTALCDIIFNTKTNKTQFYQQKWDDLLYRNEDDVKGSRIPVKYLCSSDARGVYYYYNSEDAIAIREFAVDGLLTPDLDQIDKLKTLDKDANPILLYYEFKD